MNPQLGNIFFTDLCYAIRLIAFPRIVVSGQDLVFQLLLARGPSYIVRYLLLLCSMVAKGYTIQISLEHSTLYASMDKDQLCMNAAKSPAWDMKSDWCDTLGREAITDDLPEVFFAHGFDVSCQMNYLFVSFSF